MFYGRSKRTPFSCRLPLFSVLSPKVNSFPLPSLPFGSPLVWEGPFLPGALGLVEWPVLCSQTPLCLPPSGHRPQISMVKCRYVELDFLDSECGFASYRCHKPLSVSASLSANCHSAQLLMRLLRGFGGEKKIYQIATKMVSGAN
jgi:hypothetical protein